MSAMSNEDRGCRILSRLSTTPAKKKNISACLQGRGTISFGNDTLASVFLLFLVSFSRSPGSSLSARGLRCGDGFLYLRMTRKSAENGSYCGIACSVIVTNLL